MKNYDSPSCSEPLPSSSPRNSPLNSHSPCYSAPPPHNSPPPSHTNLEDVAAPLNFNLLPPRPLNEDPPLYFTGENQLNFYFVGEMIGSAGDMPVYRALFCPFGCEPLKIPVALRRVNLEIQAYYDFVTEINKNRLVDDSNIVAVREEVNVGGCLWLVFEFVGPSLRVLYPRGAPVQVIANTLFNAVKALVCVHENDLIHGDVNVGNMFVQQEPPYLCKLGFGATVYECVQEDLAGGFLPLDYICVWGDAPEVHSKGRSMYRTKFSDTWQLGISAVELAIGNIWVKDREGFDEIVYYATKVWDFGVFENADFKNLLVECLNENPEMRPTSEQLLHHAFFRNNHPGPAQH